MGRFSLNTRPIFDPNEPTYGESLSRGIGAAAEYIATRDVEDRNFRNKVSEAGGEVTPGPSISDRWNSRPTWLGGQGSSFVPQQAPQVPPNSVEGAGGYTGVAPHPLQLPRGVTPFNGAASAAPQAQQQPQQPGIASSIRDTYDIEGPHGMRATLPVPGVRERGIADQIRQLDEADYAAAAGGDANAKARIMARHPDLMKNDAMFNPKTPQQTPEYKAKQDRFKELVDSGMTPEDANKRLRLEFGDTNGTSGLDANDWENRENIRFGHQMSLLTAREDAIAGRASGKDQAPGKISTQERADLMATISAARALIPTNAFDLAQAERDPQRKAEIANARRVIAEASGRLNENAGVGQNVDDGMAARRMNADPKTIQMRMQKLTMEAKRQFPNATPEQVKRAVRNALKAEGWPIQ